MSEARHARRRRSHRVVRLLSIAGLGAGITAAGAGAAFAADYTVKPGDTLSEVAQAHGTNWQQLAELNKLRDPNLILAGQTLRLDGAKKSGVTAERTAKTDSKAPRTVREPRRASTPKVEQVADRTTRVSRSQSSRPQTTAATGRASLSGAWAKVANCESSGNPRAVSPAGYYGLFQFDLKTWRGVGGSGNPINASAGEQLMRAKRLYAQRGASPWPVCGRFLR
jgi:LysM repeat protein